MLAAVCPHPPLLVPEVAQGASAELGDLRAACDTAAGRLVAAAPERILVVGPGHHAGRWGNRAGGSLRTYGLDVRAGGGGEELPLALTIGAWLLDRAGWEGERSYRAVTRADWQPESETGQTALLCMADGTAKRTTTAPGYLDERAEAFDAEISRSLAAGDTAALASLDAGLATQLWCTGVPAWWHLAAVWPDQVTTATVHHDAAPYGVGYVVATWV